MLVYGILLVYSFFFFSVKRIGNCWEQQLLAVVDSSV